MSAAPITGTLRRLLVPGEPEVTCEVCFVELDPLRRPRGARPGRRRAVPGMRAHLAGCPACRQEHQILKALVSSD